MKELPDLIAKNAVANTPTNPPVMLDKKMTQGESPNANPVGMATYISKVPNAATVSILKNIL